MTDIGLLAGVLFAYSLVSRRLARAAISGPMVFVSAGIILGPDVAGLTDLALTSETGLLLAELALVIVLFADAARIDLVALRGNRSLPSRLLGIGMPLTIVLGTLAGALLLPGIEFWEAAMIAAVLAPTDAALGQAVVGNPRVPARIRQALNVESGLNDGLAIPFLFLFAGLAISQADLNAQNWGAFAAQQVGVGAAVGIGAGYVGAHLITHATRRGWIAGAFQQLSLVGLAVGAWALAGELGGNGFIAAFAAGLAASTVRETCGQTILDFTEDEGQLLQLSVFFVFGVSAIGFLDAATWQVVLYGALSLTVVRMVPVAIALATSELRPLSIAFIAWFGPRGLASIILALVVLIDDRELPGIPTLFAAMTVTVLASIYAHGMTARPLAFRYARAMGDTSGGAEHAPVMDLPVRGQQFDGID